VFALATHVSPLPRQGSRLLPEHPPARVAIYQCGSAAWSAARPPLRELARRLRTRSIARSRARTIVTCPKSAPPRTLPPAVGAQKQGGALAPTMFLEQPDPSADSRGVRKSRRALPDYDFQRRAPPAPFNRTSFARTYGVAALGSGCEAEPKASRRRGAECVAFQGFSSVVNHRSPLQSVPLKPYKANVGAIVGAHAGIEPYRTCPTSSAIGRVPISSEMRM
jgi:hypothetical protein